MGMFRDKDYRKVIRKTEKYADTILTIAAPDNPRALTPQELADAVREFHSDVRPFDNIEAAVAEAYQLAGKEDVIILLGDVGLNYFGADKDRENKKNLRIFQIISCVFMEIMRKDFIIYKLTEHKSGVEERYIMSRNIRIYYLQKTEKFMILMGKRRLQ